MGVLPASKHVRRHGRAYALALSVIFMAIAVGILLRSNKPRRAEAATPITATFTVKMTIQPTCVLGTNPLAFPQYSGAVDTATTTLSINCTNKTTYNIGLGPGTAIGATVTTRKVTNGSNTLNYGLFSDSDYETNWGQTVGADTVAGTGSGAAQTLTVYGRVPAGQIGAPATYTDTIVATVTY